MADKFILGFPISEKTASSELVQDGSNIGIGTDDPISGFKLDVVGGFLRVANDAATTGLELGYSAGGSTAFIQGYNRTTNVFTDMIINNSVTVKANGNVGIGTDTFASTSNLQLKMGNIAQGAVGEIFDADDNADSSRLIIGGGGGGSPQFSMRHYSAGYGVDIWISTTDPWNTHIDNRNANSGFIFRNNCNTDGSENELMRIDGSGNATFEGNVGIGTTPSAAILHVYKSSSSPTIVARFENPSGQSLVEIKSVNNNLGVLQFGDGEDGNVGAVQYDHAGNSMRFKTADTERMRITAAGNVGIGTTSPDALLHVRAATDVTGTIEVQGGKATVTGVGEVNSELNFGSNDGSIPGGIGGSIKSITEFANGAKAGMGFYTALQGRTPELKEAMRITNVGNVGIGTTNPAQGNLVLSPSTQNGDLDGLVLAYNPDGAANRVRAKLYIDNYNGYLDLKSGGDTLTTRITSAGDSYFNNGNVGIGTNVPARNLHVHSAALTDIHLTNDDTGTTSTDGGTITMAALDLLINNRESGNTRFLVAGTERMRITSTGAVSFGSSGTSYGSSGKVLTSNGNTSPTWEDAAGGGVDTISVTGTGSSRVTTIADGLKLTGVESPGGAPQGGYALIGVSNGNDNVPEGTVVSFHDSDSSESEDPFSVSVRSNGDYFWNMHGKLTIEETDANRGGDLVVENSIRFNKLDGANATGDMFIGMSSSSAPRGDGIFIGGTDKFKMHGSHATNNMELHQTGAADIEINAFSGEVQLAGSSITTSTSIKLQAALLSNQENTSVGTGTGTVANVAIATYTAAFFDFVIKLGTNVRSGTVRACHDGTNIEFTEISTADLGDTSDITLYMDISGGNMRLLAANSGPNTWSIKTLTKAI